MFEIIHKRVDTLRAALVAVALAATALSLPPAARADQTAQAPADQATPAQTWVQSLALQAATYGVPIVAMYNLRNTVAFGPNAKVRPNEIWRVENIATPAIAQKLGYVTPNVNVIYGFGFLDLHQQPIILKAPDSNGRYYVVEIVDMWTNAFAYVGGVATGYKGGTFALVGPGWHGTLPAGVRRIDCPTRWVEIQPRVHVKDQADLGGAQAVLRAITVEGLAQYEGRPAPVPLTYHYAVPTIDPNVASSHMQFTDPLQFWEIFSAAMNENPPPQNQSRMFLPQYKYLGIELGKQWEPGAVSPLILRQMRQAAAQIGTMLNASLPIVGNVKNGWVIPPASIGLPGSDNVVRSIVAVIGLTSNTPNEAIYYTGVEDSDGQPLTGAKRYTMTFRQPMQYLTPVPPGFWSLTMYDAVTSFTVSNPIDRYALGSDSNLKRNVDGSFVIYLQHDNPGPDKESNWLPAPAGPFYLTLRSYAPQPQLAKALNNPLTFQGPPAVVPELP
jgi:hypothetical protein